MEKTKTIRALEIKALCSIIDKFATMQMERIFKERKIGISVSHLIILKILRSNPFTARELSTKIFVTSATLIPMIDSLEKRGFVKRGTDKTDRRKNPITLTKRGAKLLEKASKQVDEHPFVYTVEKFGKKKADQIVSSLQELVKLMTGNDNAIKIISNTVKKEANAKGDL